MDFAPRTDLACESMEKKGNLTSCKDYQEEQIDGFKICRFRIQNDEAAARIGKPKGTYVTVECGDFGYLSNGDTVRLARLLANELLGMTLSLTGRAPSAQLSVLVAGLGNAELTADAIGPKTVEQLTATRHLQVHDRSLYQKLGCCSLSTLSPGVLGQTGIETLELLQGTVDLVSPDLVVVIDALAARSCARLASTVQITDTGIVPGSGVGNHRAAITHQTLGVPVMVLGIPTVVDSATLVYDALSKAGITDIDENLKGVLESGKSFFVSPKESDLITKCASRFLAEAINRAFVGEHLLS